MVAVNGGPYAVTASAHLTRAQNVASIRPSLVRDMAHTKLKPGQRAVRCMGGGERLLRWGRERYEMEEKERGFWQGRCGE